MTMRPLRWALFLIGVLLPAMITLGDGGVFFPWDPRGHADVFQPTQKVYIHWNGSEETLLIQTRYEGPAEEMIWIVPVPAQPTVARGDGAVFEQVSAWTTAPDLSFTDFAGLQFHGVTAGVSGSSGSTPVAWQRRVGDYDVALLRPVEAESVLQWLNANDFTIPDEIVPVLEDYIENQWWMVASRIAPEALTPITRDRLADGTLHPLELVFASSACVYPMRLTSMAAGPVEELIYIEGPTHYEPVTFADEKWDIGLFSGPTQEVANGTYLSDVEYAIAIAEGRATRILKPCITRLHRVFQPEEMVDDLVFGPLDYAQWLAGSDPLRIAQAATQYGRQRDPNGIPHLLSTLSPSALDLMNPAPNDYQLSLSPSARVLSSRGLAEWLYYWHEPYSRNGDEGYAHIGCTHMRCCIWALGEIALEHEVATSIEDTLVRCAEHDNQLIRMEAYLALIKLGSVRIAPILSDRVLDVCDCFPMPVTRWYWDLQAPLAEMEIVGDWIQHFGARQEKDTLVDALADQLERTSASAQDFWSGPERQWSTPYSWTEWVVWRAACSQDPRLLTALQELHARLIDEDHPVFLTMRRAEAACGSAEATATLVAQIVDDEAGVLAEGQTDETGGITSLRHFFHWATPSLRVQIMRKRWWRYEFYPMPPEAADALLRLALSDEGLSDWYALYLLARIERPQTEDIERLLEIWNKGDAPMTLVAADVLFAWGDEQLLLDWYDRTDLPEVRAEIAWALAELEAPQAVDLIEEQARDSWNALWKTYELPFLLRPSSRSGYTSPEEPLAIDAVRTAETLWRYFHPQPGVLDEERLACLQRLTADETIAPDLRIELLASGYETAAWAQPLLQVAAAELLEADHTPETVRRLVSYTNSELVVDIAGQAGSDEFRRSLLNNLLTGPLGRNLAVLEGLLWEVWPRRYAETDGASLLFRTPENPDFDGYCRLDRFDPTLADALESLVQDDAMPAGYRAFLIIHWLGAIQRIPVEVVENLLQEDMPEFLHDALAQRLLDWP